MLNQNRSVNGTFGATAAKAYNFIVFTGTFIGRCLFTTWGVGAGASYAVVAPVVTLLAPSVVATSRATFAGIIWPGMKYTWNGFAWVLAAPGNEPAQDQKSNFLTWHPNYNYKRN